MIKLLFSLSIFFSLAVNAQTDSLQSFSYYFKNNDCSAYKSISGFGKTNYFGTYKLVENKHNQMRVTAGDDLVIDEHGVYIAKNKLLSISREEVRENSRYLVKNGYLHGVTLNDSIPTFLQDSSYYFLMPTKAFLFDASLPTQKLYKVNNTTFLVFTNEDNGYYSVLNIQINQGKISLSELDLTYNETNAIVHTTTTENGIKTFILSPKKSQWSSILSGFEMYDSYQKK